MSRTLAERESIRYQDELANSLINLSGWLSDIGRFDDALTAAQEAVAILRELRDGIPGAKAHLAHALQTLGRSLAETGRHSDAVAAEKETVAIYRTLTKQQPRRHQADLAKALSIFRGRTEHG